MTLDMVFDALGARLMGPRADGQRLVDAIAGFTLFSDLSEPDLARIAQVAVRRSFPAGSIILREGDPGDTCYVIRTGGVRITGPDCATGVLKGRCPNCGGTFAPRPTRAAHLLAKNPASTERVLKPNGCAA